MPADREHPAWGWMARNRIRLTWWGLPLLLGLAWWQGARPVSLLPPSGTRATAALLLLLAGLLIRNWAAAVIDKDRAVAALGPYSWCRHPLYVSNTLILAGLLTAWSGPWVAALVAPLWLLVYWPTLRNEEQVVSDKFPVEWASYQARVGRLFPRRWPPQGLGQGASLDRWRANREYELWRALLPMLIVGEVFARWL